MTAAVDHLAPAPARHRLADPSMILWIAMIAILIFLIASPMVRLVVSSFQDPETGRLTFANYVEAYGRARELFAQASDRAGQIATLERLARLTSASNPQQAREYEAQAAALRKG